MSWHLDIWNSEVILSKKGCYKDISILFDCKSYVIIWLHTWGGVGVKTPVEQHKTTIVIYNILSLSKCVWSLNNQYTELWKQTFVISHLPSSLRDLHSISSPCFQPQTINALIIFTALTEIISLKISLQFMSIQSSRKVILF